MPRHQFQTVQAFTVPQTRRQEVKRAKGDHAVPTQRTRMHMANRPVGIVAQRVDRFDRHHRAFKGRHAVKAKRDHHHPNNRIGAQLVPCARKRHQTVDHAPPRRHPQDDRHHHAQRRGPFRQRGIVQVVRTSPDIKEDQRPKVDDRQLVAIDRTLCLLGHKVIHHAQKARSQEEAHRVVTIPPLRHRILHTRKNRHRLRREKADRDRHIVDQMQHRHRDDHRQKEPVCDVDMGFFALDQRAHKDNQESHPNHCQPDINVPDRLGVFFALGASRQIRGRRQHDHQLPAPEHEPAKVAAPKPRA